MSVLDLFNYMDGDLVICKKWTMTTSLGKKVGKGVCVNGVYYKKENIIWQKYHGDIPKDKVVKFVNKNDYRVENLFLSEYEYSGGRPIGSIDKKKRMIKNSLSIEDERYIRNNWGKEGVKSFMKKFNISKCTVMNIKKEMNLPNKLSISNCIKYKINVENNIKICGIYAIVTDDGRTYVGSSVNINNRLKTHIINLTNNLHVNKSLQNSWNKNVYFALIEECDEINLLSRENYYINNICKLHNVGKINNSYTEDIYKVGYDRIKDKIIILDNGCYEVNCHTHGSGYKYINIKDKKVATHRIMFYYTNSNVDESMIIRHKCNNKSCCNPDHLECGSCRDNLIDIKREEMKRFKNVYIDSDGDIELLSKTFNIAIKTVKSRVYEMELNKKYGKPKRLKIQKSEV